MATKRRRFAVRHTYTDAHGKSRTGVATILAASSDEAATHARKSIVNIGRVLGVSEQPRAQRGFRW